MDNNIINIAYCTDSNYLEYVAVSIKSIILNNLNEKLQFHVFLYNVNENDIKKLQQTSNLIFIYQIEQRDFEKYNHNFSTTHITNSTFIRLMVPRLLSGKVKELLYLDADVLCFNNIASIRNINIDNYICAAAVDSKHNGQNPNASRLNLNSNNYFNAGVLYINIENWMNFDVENKSNDILLKNIELKYADQDALNIVLQHNTKIIDSKWNYLFTWMADKQKEEFFDNKDTLPYFIHFTGPRKMWYIEHKCLAQNLYQFYKHFTPWSKAPLKSYKDKMRPVDYRVYAKQFFRQGALIKGIKYYFIYLLKKLECH